MTVSPEEQDRAWKPSFNPWIISISVMLATFMEVLDTSIANVALPHIAGSMSASTEEATWVLTSYLVSNAIILPTTGWLSRYFGRKNFLIACIILFTLASALCGAANSLGLLIFARILQGAGGGALQPIAQAVMLESFPHHKRGMAMAAYGMGVVVAPILGPTLGGWITDAYSWRWSFYINVPIGIIAVLMAQAFVEDPPYIRGQRSTRIDYIGFGFMAVWLATLQIMLDKGQQEDWFASHFIVTLAVISGLAFLAFVAWELHVAQPIVDLRVLLNRNFTIGILMIFALGVVLYGTIALLPLFLQTLLGYPAYQSGLTLSPRGFGSMFAMIVVGRIIGRVDSRWLMAVGFGLLAYSAFLFGGFSLDISMRSVIWPNIINGMSTGLIFVPLTTICMGTLPNEQMGNATGIYNLMRNLGGGLGIAMVTALLSRSAQTHQATMAAHMTPYDPAFMERLHALTSALTPQLGANAAGQAAYAMIYDELLRQANLWSYVADFRLLAYLCLACMPLVFLFKRVKARRGAVAAH
jgi:DHA2 family multidrug resistance protein